MFELYPKIIFKNREITDVTIRYSIRDYIKENVSMIEFYRLSNGEIPRVLAHKLYGKEEYEWILFLVNDIINPLFGWLMSDEELEEYIDKKYGDKRYDIHHYELEDGTIVDKDHATGWDIVTNDSFERRENEKKREIVVLKPEYVSDVENELERRLTNAELL